MLKNEIGLKGIYFYTKFRIIELKGYALKR